MRMSVRRPVATVLGLALATASVLLLAFGIRAVRIDEQLPEASAENLYSKPTESPVVGESQQELQSLPAVPGARMMPLSVHTLPSLGLAKVSLTVDFAHDSVVLTPIIVAISTISPEYPGADAWSGEIREATEWGSSAAFIGEDRQLSLDVPALTYSLITLTADLAGTTISNSILVDPIAGGQSRAARICLGCGKPGPTTCIGVVLDRATRLPVRNATLWLCQTEPEELNLDEIRASAPAATTDAAGAFSVSISQPQAQVIVVMASGFSSRILAPRQTQIGSGMPIEVQLDSAGWLHVQCELAVGGRVGRGYVAEVTSPYHVLSSADDPFMPSRYVNGQLRWARELDTGGQAEFEGLPIGSELHVSVRRTQSSRWEVERTVILKEWRTEIGFILGSGYSIILRCVDQFNHPVARQQLWLFPRNDGAEGGAPEVRPTTAIVGSTDADGRAAFDKLQPGTWMVCPAGPEYVLRDFGSESVARRAYVFELSDRDLVLDIRLDRGLYITGRVVGESGMRLGSVRITARNKAGHFTNETWSDSTGAFRLGPLMAGDYVVVAQGSSKYRSSAESEASAGENGLCLVVGAGGSVYLEVSPTEVAAAAGSMAFVGRIDTNRNDLTAVSIAAPERTQIRGLDDGRYVILCKTRGGLMGVSQALAVNAAVSPVFASVTLELPATLKVDPGDSATERLLTVWVNGMAIEKRSIINSEVQTFTLPAGQVRVVCETASGEGGQGSGGEWYGELRSAQTHTAYLMR